MDYLDRNAEIFKEIRESRLELTRFLSVSNKARTTNSTSLGCYRSELIGRGVCILLKEKLGDSEIIVNSRIESELPVICTIYEKIPELREELPLFYGLLRGKDEKLIGIITEDFSKAGIYPVREIEIGDKNNLPYWLNRLSKKRIDETELSRVGFMVDGQRRLGDFDTISIKKSNSSEKFSIDSILKRVNEFTLRINYEL